MNRFCNDVYRNSFQNTKPKIISEIMMNNLSLIKSLNESSI